MTIDLDAFFTSCEELRNPKYKLIPIVVANDEHKKGVISTANYNARKLGIKSGMPVFKAKEIFNDIKIVFPDHDFYIKKANEVFLVIKKFSKKIEISSIDECYIDITDMTKFFKPIIIAKMISNEIENKTGLSVSIGISTNIILSKMASNIDKPKGITTLYKHEIKLKLWSMPVGNLHMVGFVTEKVLIEKEIRKIGELASLKNNIILYRELKMIIGINLDKIINSANGIGRSKVNSSYTDLKSVSKEKTLEHSIIDIDYLKKDLRLLFDIVFYRLTIRKMNCSSIKVIIKRDKEFNNISATKKLKIKTDNKEELWSISSSLIEDIFESGMSIKQIGVSFQGLCTKERTYKQLLLFESNKTEGKIQDIANLASDKLNMDVFKGSTMKDNIKFKKDKQLTDNDSVKFKVWEK